MRRVRLAATRSAACALAAAAFAVPARAFTPVPPPLCKVVKSMTPSGVAITVQITSLDGTGCRTARKAMSFCIRHRRVKGWVASRKAYALINTQGTKAIYFSARPVPPRCWGSKPLHRSP